MCVIALCSEGKRLTESMVEDMFWNNPKGAGIAWREKRGKKVVVKWEKGLDLNDIKALCLTTSLPYAAHFRVPTCGPREGIFKPLTHPFPISPEVELACSGEYEGAVLFHNGMWHNWENKTLDMAIKGGWKLPEGKWSDSRAMAFAAWHLGLGVLDFINEKAVIFGPEKIFMVSDGWTLTADQIWVSNLSWRSAADWRKNRSSSSASSAQSTQDKEDHTPAHLRPQSSSSEAKSPSAGSGTTGEPSNQTTTTAGPGTTIASPSRADRLGSEATELMTSLARIPRDASVSKGPGGTLRVTPFVQGKPSPADRPFLIEATDHVVHLAEMLHRRVDSRGVPLLSKSRLKKIHYANEVWKSLQNQSDQDKHRKRIKEALDRCQEGLGKTAIIH